MNFSRTFPHLVHRHLIPIVAAVLLALVLSLGWTLPLAAQNAASPADREALEAKFKATLTEATLKGRWTGIKEGGLTEEKEDSYHIVGVTKLSGNNWIIRARIQYAGRDFVAPVPVQVEFAGDTPVIVVDNVGIPGGNKYSARVLFHGDTYAGTWSGANVAGLMSGLIHRAPKESAAPETKPTTPPSTHRWPQWRGPNLDGSTTATGLPVEWSETQNVRWKTALPWWSGSTPVVWDDHIFVLSPGAGDDKAQEPSTPALSRTRPDGAPAGRGGPTGDRPQRRRGPGGFGGGGFGGGEGGPGAARLSPGGNTLLLLCLDRRDGSIRWTEEIDEGNTLWRKHNNTSPSPVTDGEHVWVLTGNGTLVCMDFDGNTRWRRNFQQEYGPFGQNHGFGASPLLHEDRLIVPVLHGMRTDKPSYLVAVDKATGENLWKVDRLTDARSESPDAYTTPQRVVVGDRVEIILNGGDVVTGHDMATGREIWRADVLNPRKSTNYRIVPSCLVVGDLVVAPTRENPLTALRLGGQGDITDTHVVWQFASGPDVPTPVSDGKYLWTLSGSRSQLSCLNLQTGEVLYDRERLPSGTYSSSPVLAEGRLYIPNESGTVVVVDASAEFKILATNSLEESYTLSSPVVLPGEILMRTGGHLYSLAQSTP